MNRSRVIVLVAAAFAAGLAALLMRGLLGGGTEKSAAAQVPAIATTQVLVAATNVVAGEPLSPASVRWQTWPKATLDSTLITHDASPDINATMTGTVARTSMVAGEPLTEAKFVHAGAAGFMAARLTPGMRAISIAISTESGAGGFILPNDRVDILMTVQVSENPRRSATHTLLRDIRVLAVDQTAGQDTKDQKVVLGKTATLELTPHQTEMVERAAATGTLSLSLRALGDTAASEAAKVAVTDTQKLTAAPSTAAPSDGSNDGNGGVAVIRYNIAHANQAGD
jgi:pilus assembly protein CpaB